MLFLYLDFDGDIPRSNLDTEILMMAWKVEL